MNKLMKVVISIVSLLFLINFIHASAYGFCNPDLVGGQVCNPSGTSIAIGSNLSINVNNSQYLQGFTPQQVANLFTEKDPIYSANIYATGMDQGVATGDSVTFNSISGDGSGLTNVPSLWTDNLDGTISPTSTNIPYAGGFYTESSAGAQNGAGFSYYSDERAVFRSSNPNSDNIGIALGAGYSGGGSPSGYPIATLLAEDMVSSGSNVGLLLGTEAEYGEIFFSYNGGYYGKFSSPALGGTGGLILGTLTPDDSGATLQTPLLSVTDDDVGVTSAGFGTWLAPNSPKDGFFIQGGNREMDMYVDGSRAFMFGYDANPRRGLVYNDNLGGGLAFYDEKGGGEGGLGIGKLGDDTLFSKELQIPYNHGAWGQVNILNKLLVANLIDDGSGAVLQVTGGISAEGLLGITTTQTFKDDLGVTKTMTITDGIITDIS
jgi:hypothetical protein